MSNSPQSQSGWQYLNNIQANRKVRIGAISAVAAAAMFGDNVADGVLELYGRFQGAKASHTCEAALVSEDVGSVTYSCLNPLPEGESGAILAVDTNGVFVGESASPATRLNIGTATTATAAVEGTSASADVASGVVIEGTNRWLALSETGALTIQAPAVLAPRDYEDSRRYLNFTFQRGSGQTLSGNPPAFVHIEIQPCSVESVGC